MSRELLLRRFQAVVAARPDSCAVSDGENAIDYQTLDRRSDDIARELASLSSSRSRRAALLCGHRVSAIVAMLGAAKGGWCLVPLNGHESDAHLANSTCDASAEIVLADRMNSRRAQSVFGGRPPTLDVDSVDWHGEARWRRCESQVDDDPPDLLAILYTSGTTSDPKGVMTSAASVLERAKQYIGSSCIAPGERQAAIMPWHFAVSLPEIYGALLSGAALLLYDAHATGVEGIPEWVSRERVSCLQLPVAMARRLLARKSDLRFDSLRFASVGGDRLRRSEAEALIEAMPSGATLLHVYGSTETNLISQLALTRPASAWPRSSDGGFLPVGRPVEGKRVRIVDADLTQVRAGEVGRVAVEGSRISPGYWRQAERTAECFGVTSDGLRRYLTGDFGRLRRDGLLELVGRDASNVKVRGMRVDVGAVETALLGLGTVAAAAVNVVEGPASDPQLIGYLESRAGVELNTTFVRRALEEVLPSHWIPARFVFLTALPWTANGKIDRKRLPDPGRSRPRQEVDFIAPRNADEALVCECWAARFDLERVGAEDCFFDLGGDSLSLVESLDEIERISGRSVSLSRLDALPTPARLALQIGTASKASRESAAEVAIHEPGILGALDRTLSRIRARSAPWRVVPPSARRFQKAVKRRVRHPLRLGGPMLFGYPVGYAIGYRLHSRTARALVSLGLFRCDLSAITSWHARLGLDVDLEQTLARSVMANTWSTWRLRALEDRRSFEKWVTVTGVEYLESAVGCGRGVVLVVTHVHWNALIERLPALGTRERLFIRQPKGRSFGSGPDAVVTERAELVRAAKRTLRRGGVVLIAGDDGRGRTVLEHAFHGATHEFHGGPATLAETTGASILPVFSRLLDDGRIGVRIEAPLLGPGSACAEQRVLDLTRRYAERLTAAWPEIFDSVTWKSARRALGASTLAGGRTAFDE